VVAVGIKDTISPRKLPWEKHRLSFWIQKFLSNVRIEVNLDRPVS
jgi:hypothetical protein